MSNKVSPDAPASHTAGPTGTLPTPTCSRCQSEFLDQAQFCRTCGLERRDALAPPIGGIISQFGRKNTFRASGLVLCCAAVRIFMILITPAKPAETATPPETPKKAAAPRIIASASPTTRVLAPIVTVATTQPSDSTETEAPSEPTLQFVLSRTAMLGDIAAGGAFEKKSRINGEPIIGFRIVVEESKHKSTVRTFEPIFPSDNLIPTPSMTVAKPGYAVGGIEVAGDDSVAAIRVHFMRMIPHALDPNDSYQSEWQGDRTGFSTYLLGGGGERVVGVYGRRGIGYAALGLILRGATYEKSEAK